MTAATLTRPAAPVATSVPTLKLSVVGQLLRPAEVRTSTDGSAHIHLLVLQPQDALAFLAVFHAAPEQRELFTRIAQQLTAGSGVLLLGRGITFAKHDGKGVLRLVQCDGFAPADLTEFLTDGLLTQPQPEPAP